MRRAPTSKRCHQHPLVTNIYVASILKFCLRGDVAIQQKFPPNTSNAVGWEGVGETIDLNIFQQAKSESSFKSFRDVFRVWFLMRNELIFSFSDWLDRFWSSFKRVFWRQTCSPSAVIEEKERLC